MPRLTGPIDWSDAHTYQCVDCAFALTYDEAVDGPPSDFLVVQPRGTVERVVTLGGNEVHRCRSAFLMPAS